MSVHPTSINLKELSSLTGFSISTVSKALNNKLDVSARTRRYIRSIADQHNYIPNGLAASLRLKKSRTIAIIIPQINIDFYSNLLFNFQKIADRHDYRIVVFQSFEREVKEIEYLESICDGSIDGAIVITNLRNKYYSRDYTIPVLSLSIMETLSKKDLKGFCSHTFEKLLTKRKEPELC
ncbi:MAG: hypothetical protein Aureis2KO_32370 [Aureisphaera sp.]